MTKEQIIDAACTAFCKVCDTQECGGTFECNWVAKFRKKVTIEINKNFTNSIICKDLNEDGTCNYCKSKYGKVIHCKDVSCSRKANKED
jgi:hypothetical protein